MQTPRKTLKSTTHGLSWISVMYFSLLLSLSFSMSLGLKVCLYVCICLLTSMKVYIWTYIRGSRGIRRVCAGRRDLSFAVPNREKRIRRNSWGVQLYIHATVVLYLYIYTRMYIHTVYKECTYMYVKQHQRKKIQSILSTTRTRTQRHVNKWGNKMKGNKITYA